MQRRRGFNPNKPKISLKILPNQRKIRSALDDNGLTTVCEKARCPNKSECWNAGTATFMILGDKCERHCSFCGVPTAKDPPTPDPEEPEKVARSIANWSLSYAVITSVNRNKLPDQGASHFASTVEQVRRHNPNTKIELLIPDFQGDTTCLDIIAASGPHVLAHNVETVPRLQSYARHSRASYKQSLGVLAYCKRLGFPTKSSIMVGIGETLEEVKDVLRDLRAIDTDFLTIGQYYQPINDSKHLWVSRSVPECEFLEYKSYGEQQLGFAYVASGPLVRSSYRAGEYFIAAQLNK